MKQGHLVGHIAPVLSPSKTHHPCVKLILGRTGRCIIHKGPCLTCRYIYIYGQVLRFQPPPMVWFEGGEGVGQERTKNCEGCSAPASTLTLTLKALQNPEPRPETYTIVCHSIRFRASCNCRRLLLLRSSQEIARLNNSIQD